MELAPWYPRLFEFQPKIEVLSQHSRSIASDHGTFLKPLHANYLNFGIGYPYYNWYGELELIMADSKHRYYDNTIVTGRYQLTNDVSGESFLSSVAALSVTASTRNALYDLNSFHHGKFEAIAHLSAGKEFVDNQFWCYRIWGTLGIGAADVGSPWMHLKFSLENNFRDRSILGFFVESFYGLGGNALSKHKKFHGYGSIRHRSIDFGAFYSYIFDGGQKLSFGGRYRAYARNFPEHAASISLIFLSPFAL